eukprot:CAMPEP_0119346192 /NCGR_PEP_ID=MMETSP1333-20130426/107879_1 /TAXON_ID=418940 /ORGANISM="Scyphosphaera apsteinii, Strain RCC1455" /LENGTH=58 /DNA_ID=CAMNT_0007358691 /DNA_START=596 /DNA_END=772 /DNA_ORIENTATION=+
MDTFNADGASHATHHAQVEDHLAIPRADIEKSGPWAKIPQDAPPHVVQIRQHKLSHVQ